MDDETVADAPKKLQFKETTIQVPKKILVSVFRLESWQVQTAIREWVRREFEEITSNDAVLVVVDPDNPEETPVEVTVRRDG